MAEIEIEITERRSRNSGSPWGASWAGSTELIEHHLVLRRGGRLYDACVTVEQPAAIPPVHGPPATDPPAVRHVEIGCRPSGRSPRGLCWSELRAAATTAALETAP